MVDEVQVKMVLRIPRVLMNLFGSDNAIKDSFPLVLVIPLKVVQMIPS